MKNGQMRSGDRIVILDSGRYYGKMAEYQSDTGSGIFCICPIGGRNALITAWRWRATEPGDPQ